jgi:PelA/Pel-15E family pectate lyase
VSSLARLMLAWIVLFLIGAGPVSLREATTRPADWFATDQAQAWVDNVISWQTPGGGWAKGYDPTHKRERDESPGAWNGIDTIDNGATTSEIRFLARAHTIRPTPLTQGSLERGLDALLKAQYPSGGWPQRFPITRLKEDDYARHITFNDNAMINVLTILSDVSRSRGDFAWIDQSRAERAKVAVQRAIECIVRSQVRVDGQLTGWCAQHDADTLAPAGARSFEPVSLSGSEGSNIVMFLMSIESPGPDVQNAIHAAVAWFERSKVVGKRVSVIDDPERPGKKRKELIQDPAAPAMWARFYEVGTNRPMFLNRDGVIHYDYARLDQERSMGYSWWGNWGAKVLNAYPDWCQKHAQVRPE